MTEPESQTSPLVNMFLATVLFLCFGAVVFFALMAGLTDAGNTGPQKDAYLYRQSCP